MIGVAILVNIMPKRDFFPKGHALHKLFNRNTVKVFYSCMNNMASIISGHNAKILNSNTEVNNGGKECNCRKRDECPLNGACLTESIIYKASVSAKNLPTKYYYGVTESDFNTRWRNHKTSFTNANYKNVTELSHYIGNFVINMVSHMMTSIYHGA